MSSSYIAIVSQAIDLLDDLSSHEYQKTLPPHFPSSIGAHMRHIVDHFTALLDGIETRHVNYNKRNRYNEVEQTPQYAIEAFEKITKRLENIESSELDLQLSVTSEIDVQKSHSTTCSSTVERELVFVSSHAIHHYALVKVMCAMQNKDIPKYFGYAPATITNINQSA